MPNALLCIWNLSAPVAWSLPIWAFEMWMHRWNALCPSEHSKSECFGGFFAFEIWMLRRNSFCLSEHSKSECSWNAQCQFEHSKSEWSHGMPNAHLSIQNLNAAMECRMPIWAFEILMLRWNAQCHLCIRNVNALMECPMLIWAFKIYMLRWNARCPSEH